MKKEFTRMLRVRNVKVGDYVETKLGFNRVLLVEHLRGTGPRAPVHRVVITTGGEILSFRVNPGQSPGITTRSKR